MRGRGTIWSIASIDVAATAATKAVQFLLFSQPAGALSELMRLAYQRDASSTDGDLDRGGAEASGEPTTCWRGSYDEREPSTGSFRWIDNSCRFAANEGFGPFQFSLSYWFSICNRRSETAMHVTASHPFPPQLRRYLRGRDPSLNRRLKPPVHVTDPKPPVHVTAVRPPHPHRAEEIPSWP